MKIQGRGQLRHHFWGSYFATISLEFTNPRETQIALNSGLLLEDWAVSNIDNILICTAGDENGSLNKIINNLVSLGAKRKKIASIAHSVDFGDPFKICIETANPDQLDLF